MAHASEREVDPSIGARIRMARVQRGMSQQELAGLVGCDQSNLSRIERGLQAVHRRAQLERFAAVLELPYTDLLGLTGVLGRRETEEDPAITPLRLALADIEIGEAADGPPPAWDHVARRVEQVNDLRPRADHKTLTALLPALVQDLHASSQGPHRREALVGLVDTYLAAQVSAAHLGASDLAQVAALRLRDVAAHLDGPEWQGVAAWARVQAIGGSARRRAYAVASRAADTLDEHLDQTVVAEMAGMLHLSAALAATVIGDHGSADDQLQHARQIARRPAVGTANFARLTFGPGNVGIWTTLLAVERGEGGRVEEIARQIDPAVLPRSASRRCAWHIDRGRGLADDHQDELATRMFQQARRLAPQRAHADPRLRHTVGVMLQRRRRSELSSLAGWLGIGR